MLILLIDSPTPLGHKYRSVDLTFLRLRGGLRLALVSDRQVVRFNLRRPGLEITDPVEIEVTYNFQILARG